MSSMKWTRRHFAMSLGATLLAAPFVELLQSTAQAAPSKTAERLVLFFSPNGTIHKHWRPTGSGGQFSFPKGSILEPLAPYQSDLLVLDGLNFVGATNHAGGMAAMLTGGGTAAHESKGMSIDQFVASKIGAKSRFSSLEFGVQTSAWGGNPQTRMSYRGPGQMVPPNDDPVNVYRRLWGAAAQGVDPQELLKQKKSVLDFVKDEMTQLKQILGAEEKRKLDQHLQSMRQVEKGLQVTTGCSAPSMQPTVNPQKNEHFDKVGALQTKLLVQSLACGMTRVASIQWSHTVGPTVFSWLGINEGHHALSHMSDTNVAGVQKFVKAERWFASQFAELLKQLKATPDPKGGGNLLDTSLVVWCKELGDGRMHTCTSVPFVVAGGGAGWKMGQYLKLSSQPHQKLLVSLCHGMGLKNTTFGDPSRSTGLLSGLGA